MAKELDAETGSLMGALDQPGDVGEDQGSSAFELGHAEVGVEGGEGIRGDLGPGTGERRQQGGLAGVGETDQADVGDQLQLQVDPPLLARLPQLAEPWSLADGSGEAGVAPAAPATRGHHQALAGDGEVPDQLAALGVGDHRPRGHGQHQIGAVGAAPLGPATRPPVGSVEVASLAIAAEAALVIGDSQHDAPAPAPVAAVRAAHGDVLLVPEADRAASAGAGADVEADLVEEHG